MSLADERIFEILKSIEPCSVRLPLGLKLFAKAIEQEVTKPQEPVAWLTEDYNRMAASWWDNARPVFSHAAPQPCPECQSRANGAAVLVPSAELKKMQAVIAGYERDQKEHIFEQGDQAKVIAKQAERITELEAEDSAVQLLKDSTITQQAERIAELEAEVLSKEGMALVTKEDAENYCRILTLLGMEEEGSPVEGVERLIFLRDGMTCGDCNDTGWLENREEGRYPCTCMTEAEPYQILQVKCAELEANLEQLETDFNAQEVRMHEVRKERDALKSALQPPDRHALQLEGKHPSPCAKFCEAPAFLIEERRMKRQIAALAMQNQQMREALKEMLRNPGGDYTDDIAEAALALPDLPAEVIKRHNADKKDADRYRWLRDLETDLPGGMLEYVEAGGTALDAAIDEAMEKS